MTGMSWITGISMLGSFKDARDVEAPFSPVRRYRAKIVPPDAKVFKAIPEITELEFSFKIKYASMLLIRKPASTAPKKPIHALWVKALTTTPTKAEISMVPSRAMLLVPDREAIMAPRVVRSTGVALLKTAK